MERLPRQGTVPNHDTKVKQGALWCLTVLAPALPACFNSLDSTSPGPLSDKSKPVVRLGRKATDQAKPDSRVTEERSCNLPGDGVSSDKE